MSFISTAIPIPNPAAQKRRMPLINTVSPQPVVTRTVDQSNSLTLPLARSLTKNSNKIVLQVS
jgi:hypothetical protein